ncbi:MAG: Gfo/Idh/MocA family oxidoreductase [Thermoleophilaceae bacterium]
MALRLGLLSTARINDEILAAAAATPAVDVVAVASRDRSRAETYAEQHSLARAHGSYEDLLGDTGVDAVYISTPNGMHLEGARQALEAGKHVLCEKPLGRDPGAVLEAFDAAERNGRVLAEAFMYRHHPQIRRLGELLADGAIGALRLVRASFGFTLARPHDHRLYREHEGGALMDVGCYCVNASRFVAGAEPEQATAIQVTGGDGIDLRLCATLRFPGDLLAMIDCGFDLSRRAGLEITGSDGILTIGKPWHAGPAPEIVLEREEGFERISIEPVNAYTLELEDLAAAAAGERAPLLGRDDAVGQARTIDMIYAAA